MFCIRLFFQKYVVIVDLFALMSVYYFCTPEYVLQGFCMSWPYTDLNIGKFSSFYRPQIPLGWVEV